MSVEYVIELFREMLTTALIIVMPLLGTAMFVGVVVSLIQAVTSIQEQTLSFVPKLFVVTAVMMFTAFWMVEIILTFTVEMFNQMSTMAGG